MDGYRREHGTTVVFVTHEITPVAGLVDRVLYVAAGRWAAGTPDEVLITQSLSDLYGTHIDVIRVHGASSSSAGTTPPGTTTSTAAIPAMTSRPGTTTARTTMAGTRPPERGTGEHPAPRGEP
jgi:zinc/manganese transport system ATP-binding protein